MFIREIGGNLPRSFFEILKSKFQKSELGKFITNFPLKHVITSTNSHLLIMTEKLLSSFSELGVYISPSGPK